MPFRIFTLAELEGVASLDPVFGDPFLALADDVNAQLRSRANVTVHLESFRRDGAEQLATWKLGRAIIGGRWEIVDPAAVATYARAGESAHEYGLAAHLVLRSGVTGGWIANTDPLWHWLGAIVEAHGQRWGGRFKTKKGKPFFDASHVEIADWPARLEAIRKGMK